MGLSTFVLSLFYFQSLHVDNNYVQNCSTIKTTKYKTPGPLFSQPIIGHKTPNFNVESSAIKTDSLLRPLFGT